MNDILRGKKPKKVMKKSTPTTLFAKWDKGEAKFIESLAGVSRNQLIIMLGEYWLECEFLKSVRIMHEKSIKEMDKNFIELVRINSKGSADLIHTLKERNKLNEYIKITQQQREHNRQEKKQAFIKIREEENRKRKAESEATENALEKGLNDYFTKHEGRKVSNKELEDFVTKTNFLGAKTYKGTTLIKKIATIAAKIRSESADQ